MEKRIKVEFFIALILLLWGAGIMVLPLLNFTNIKTVVIATMAFYGVVHLIKNMSILFSKDYSGFFTAIICLAILIIMMFININDTPWNLALILLIWIILMSINKLKESDYYHDRKNKVWKLNVINLAIFIFVGLLTTINLDCPPEIQITYLGFFFIIHAILELTDPICGYLINESNKN